MDETITQVDRAEQEEQVEREHEAVEGAHPVIVADPLPERGDRQRALKASEHLRADTDQRVLHRDVLRRQDHRSKTSQVSKR
ncbi:MAG: hypothetical protein H6705_08665 [Myxococcales bacterium]|nr:hypothetical protein [Myxococcales bacterium]